MKFVQPGKTIILEDDSSLKKLQVSLKRMIKTWEAGDQGFLGECFSLQGMESWEEFYGIDTVFNPTDALMEVLLKYNSVFDWPRELPSSRGIDHHIHLKEGAG